MPSGKRKKPTYYAVQQGRTKGVYTTWEECAKQVQGFKGNVYKGFETFRQAEAFVVRGGVDDDDHVDHVAKENSNNRDDDHHSNNNNNSSSNINGNSKPIYSLVSQRLMTKMGHEEGQGLGKDHQGITSPVKPQRRLKGRQQHRNHQHRHHEQQQDKLGVGFVTAADKAASSMSTEQQLNDRQRHALEAAKKGQNVFLTGPAGTGKSVVLKHVMKYLEQTYQDHEWATVAPTGMTAVALGGQTLHSFAGCGIPETQQDFQRVWKERKRWRNIKVLLLDEVSLLAGEFLDHLSDVVCDIRGTDRDRPLGGIQLFVCGDFLQLPPIPKSLRDVRAMVATGRVPYDGIVQHRGFAFHAKLWANAAFEHVALTQVFRQQTNRDLIRVLHDIRQGRVSDEAVRFLRQCQRPLPPTRNGIRATQLYAQNVNVNRENHEELRRLPGAARTFVAQDSVRAAPDHAVNERRRAERVLRECTFWKNCQADRRLTLKVDAQVMLLKNRPTGSGLVNGSRGKVIGFSTEKQWKNRANNHNNNNDSNQKNESETKKPKKSVASGASNEEAINVDSSSDDDDDDDDGQDIGDEEEVKMSPDIVKKKDKTVEDDKVLYPIVEFLNGARELIVPQVFDCRLSGVGVSSRTALPLKLAWAVTIQKSQGLTLDFVKVDLKGIFAQAQAYVALSRASSVEGLELCNFNPRLVRANPEALSFYQNPHQTFPCWNTLGSDRR